MLTFSAVIGSVLIAMVAPCALIGLPSIPLVQFVHNLNLTVVVCDKDLKRKTQN